MRGGIIIHLDKHPLLFLKGIRDTHAHHSFQLESLPFTSGGSGAVGAAAVDAAGEGTQD